MKNVFWVIVLLVAALLQTAWPESLKLQEVMPDLSLLLVVYFAISEGEERAMMTGLFSGLYQDVASSAVLGHHILCLVLLAYLIGRLSTRLITEHPAIKAAFVLLAGFFQGGLFTLIQYVQEPAAGLFYPLLTSAIPTAFYTALITPFVFVALEWIFRRYEAPQGGAA